MKYLISLLMLGLLMMTMVSADLGTFKQNDCVDLKGSSDTTAMNISSISLPNSTVFATEQEMTKLGRTFNYTFCETELLGIYAYDYYDSDGNTWVNSFEITPTGSIMYGWKMAIEIFVSISTLLLMILFLYMGGSGLNKGAISNEEGGAIKFFFVGLALVFLIAHILITNVVVHDALGVGNISNSYTYVMWIFFAVIILMFLYTLMKVIFWEVDVFRRTHGLK